MDNNKKQKEKAITLIALVITIIILLILVGTTLRIVFNDGIISNTEKAVDKYEESTIEEALRLELLNYDLSHITESNRDYFTYLKNEGIITLIETGTASIDTVKLSSRATDRTEKAEDKGKKAQVNTKELIGNNTRRNYYLYENGELYVETSKGSNIEKYITDLWGENGVIKDDDIQNGQVGTTIAELIRKREIKVGDYVNYNMSDERSYNGYSSEKLLWRVFSIDYEKEQITLISEKPTSAGFKDITGEDEEIINKLNTICNELYGDGINKCRNLDAMDIFKSCGEINSETSVYSLIYSDILLSDDKSYDYYDGYLGYPEMMMTDLTNIVFEEKKIGSICYPKCDQFNYDLEELRFSTETSIYWYYPSGSSSASISRYIPLRPVMVLEGYSCFNVIENDEPSNTIYTSYYDKDLGRYVDVPYPIWNFTYVAEKPKEEKTIAEIIRDNGIRVGDYINYNISNKRTYTVWEDESDEFTLTSEMLRWKVLSIDYDKEEITLISERPTNKGFYINQSKTDEEAITELNNACNALYGDGENECRNLDVKDIENNKDAIWNMIIGNGDENFYYDNLVIDRNYEYFAMLITEGSDRKLYSIYQKNTDNGEQSNIVYNRNHEYYNGDKYSYLPMRPVIILKGDTIL